MATSVLMAATAHHHQATNPSPQDHHHHDHDGHHPIRRSSGRRKMKGCDSSSSGQKKNKQPQRGMGVEKLEKLRLQERWNRMTETNSISPGTVSFPDPISKLGGFGTPNAVLNHNPSGAYLGFQYGQMDLSGLSNSGFVGKNYVSGNLSSNRNGVKCYSEHCNACHKKKKYNGGDCGWLGLNNIGEYQNIIISQENHQGLNNVGTKMPLVLPAVGNIISKQGDVEIVAVDRKGSCSSSFEGHDHVMMEYEFFPSCKSEKDVHHHHHHHDELVMMNNLGEASSSSMPGFASNCVDLSLKLSYY